MGPLGQGEGRGPGGFARHQAGIRGGGGLQIGHSKLEGSRGKLLPKPLWWTGVKGFVDLKAIIAEEGALTWWWTNHKRTSACINEGGADGTVVRSNRDLQTRWGTAGEIAQTVTVAAQKVVP